MNKSKSHICNFFEDDFVMKLKIRMSKVAKVKGRECNQPFSETTTHSIKQNMKLLSLNTKTMFFFTIG